MKDKTQRRLFVWIHAALLLLIPLFFAYRLITELLPERMSGCILHDYLFLYCPLCGGTRSVEAILRLDFWNAFRLNAFVLLSFVGIFLLDLVSWVRFFRHRSLTLHVRGWVWVVLATLFLGFGVLRNYLMIAHGIDPIGDLSPLWNAFLR